MKIDETMMCLNCAEVFHEELETCPVCASRHVHKVNDWLSRKEFKIHGTVTGRIRSEPSVASSRCLHSAEPHTGRPG